MKNTTEKFHNKYNTHYYCVVTVICANIIFYEIPEEAETLGVLRIILAFFFFYPRVLSPPPRECPLKFSKAQETRMMGHQAAEKSLIIFSRFDIIQECDGQTDRQTDTGRRLAPRLHLASQDNKTADIEQQLSALTAGY